MCTHGRRAPSSTTHRERAGADRVAADRVVAGRAVVARALERVADSKFSTLEHSTNRQITISLGAAGHAAPSSDEVKIQPGYMS